MASSIVLSQVIANDDPVKNPGFHSSQSSLAPKNIEVLYPSPNGTGYLTIWQPIPIFANNSYPSVVEQFKNTGIEIIPAITVTGGRKDGALSGINPTAVKSVEPKKTWGGLRTSDKETIVTFDSCHKIEVLGPFLPLKRRLMQRKRQLAQPPIFLKKQAI